MNYFMLTDVHRISSDICGCAMLSPGWIHMSRKMDNTSVIILGRKNSTLINDEGNLIEIKPGRLVFLPAGNLHYGIKKIDLNVSYFWCHIQISEMSQIIQEDQANFIFDNPEVLRIRLNHNALLPQYLDLPEPEHFEILFHQLLKEFKQPIYTPLRYQLLVQDLVLQFGQAVIQLHNENEKKISIENSATKGILPKVILLVSEEISNPNLSIKDLASRLSLNPDYLGRIFLKLMKLSLSHYILQKRMELAISRLKSSDDSIDIIAANCGFVSKRQFFKNFKTYYGKTPKEFRNSWNIMYLNNL